MGLQGTLQDFGALETFQLIALQQKTGTLEIVHDGHHRHFVFENGHLLGAHESPLKLEDPLVRFLIEARCLKEDEARVWVSFHSPQPVNAVDLLLKLTELTKETVINAYDSYLQTTFDEILSWPRGRFQFYSKKVGIPSKFLGPWKIEGLLMESMRRLDELSALQAAELSPGLIPRFADGQRAPVARDPFSHAVFKRLDGRRSVQEIVAASPFAPYDLYQVLRRLRENNIIEMIEWVPSGLWMETLWQQRSRWKSVVCGGAGVAILALITLAFHFFLESRPVPWPTGTDFAFMTPTTQASRATYATAQLLEVYRLRNGHYPADLEALATDGLLSAASRRSLARRTPTWLVTEGGGSYRWMTDPEPDPEPGIPVAEQPAAPLDSRGGR